MAEHLRDEQVTGLRRRTLAPAELFAVGEHLAACAACRARVGDTSTQAAAFESLRADVSAASTEFSHLEYEQLAAFVDSELGEIDREIVESHLSLCARCAEEARELTAFAAAMNRAPAATATTHASPTFKERLAALLTPARRPWLRTRGALALLLIFVGIALALLFIRRAPSDNQIAEAPRPTVVPSASPSSTVAPQPTTTPTNNITNDANKETTAPPSEQRREPPSTIVVPAETVVALADGGQRVTLDARGNLGGLEALSPADARAVKEALRTGSVARPRELSSLFGSDGALMSGGAEPAKAFVVRGPAGTVVRETRPTLRWNTLPNADGYAVKIYDENYREAAASSTLAASEWAVPVALTRGRFYSWEVTALKDGSPLATAPAPPAPEARFKVLEQSREDELARALAAQPDSRLARGILYARAGLLDDADRELRALLTQNPRSAAARRLLRSVRGRSRQ